MSGNAKLLGHNDLSTVSLLEDLNKGIQYRLSVSEFRDTLYLSIREYYLSFEGEWAASNNGMTLPYTLDTVSKLYRGLYALLSKCETLEEVRYDAVGVLEASQ